MSVKDAFNQLNACKPEGTKVAAHLESPFTSGATPSTAALLDKSRAATLLASNLRDRRPLAADLIRAELALSLALPTPGDLPEIPAGSPFWLDFLINLGHCRRLWRDAEPEFDPLDPQRERLFTAGWKFIGFGQPRITALNWSAALLGAARSGAAQCHRGQTAAAAAAKLARIAERLRCPLRLPTAADPPNVNPVLNGVRHALQEMFWKRETEFLQRQKQTRKVHDLVAIAAAYPPISVEARRALLDYNRAVIASCLSTARRARPPE